MKFIVREHMTGKVLNDIYLYVLKSKKGMSSSKMLPSRAFLAAFFYSWISTNAHMAWDLHKFQC